MSRITIDTDPETAAAALARATALLRGVLARSSYELAREDLYDLGLVQAALEGLAQPIQESITRGPPGAQAPAPGGLRPAPAMSAPIAPTLDPAALAVFAVEVRRQRLAVRDGGRPLDGALVLQRLWRQLAGRGDAGDGVTDGAMLAAVRDARLKGPTR